MTTTQPDLLSVAAMHDERTDSWWRDCAERAATQLIQRGVEFTAHDLTDLGVPNPDVPARWGSLFASLKAAGLIIPVGYRPSPRTTRNGGVTRVWRGIPRTSPAVGAGEGPTADEPQEEGA